MRRAIRHDHSLVGLSGAAAVDSARLKSAWYNPSMSSDEAFLRHLLSGIVLQPERMRFDCTEASATSTAASIWRNRTGRL